MTDKRWWVISPAWGEVMPILDDGTGPMEWGAEVVEVEAPSRREAIIRGVKKMEFWPTYARDMLSSTPFSGVTAELIEKADNGFEVAVGEETP